DGQAGAGGTIKIGQLRIGIGRGEVGDHDFGQGHVVGAAVAVGGGRLLIGDHAGDFLAIHDIDGVAVLVFHSLDGVSGGVGAQLHHGRFAGHGLGGEDPA